MNQAQVQALQALLNDPQVAKWLEGKWPGITPVVSFLSELGPMLPAVVALLDAFFPPLQVPPPVAPAAVAEAPKP